MSKLVSKSLFDASSVVSGKNVWKTCPRFRQELIVNGETNQSIRNSSCSFYLPVIQLPSKLDRAAAKYLRDNVFIRPRDLRIQAMGLRRSLWARVLLLEKNLLEHLRRQVRKTSVVIPSRLFSEDVMSQIEKSKDPDVERMLIENASAVMKMREEDVEAIVQKEMREQSEPICYSKNLSNLYLVSRLAPNFSSACRVLYEIRKRCPNFSPMSLYDFGSGTGSAAWAASSVWPLGTIKYHLLVDASIHMLSISEYLMKDGAIKQHLTALPGVNYRSYLSASSELHDLVISNYSLLDITGGYLNRRDILTNLWRKTGKFLVLIELGTKAGFQAILEARDWLVSSTKDDEQPAQIFAPCPHSMACPKSERACNFNVKFEDFRLTEEHTQPINERFSYLILHKGDISQYQTENELILNNYPRIVSYKTGNETQDLCSSDGTVIRYHMDMSERPLKRFIRRCQSGDFMPVVASQDQLLYDDSSTESADGE